jgi:hypothetical protein
MRNSVSVCVFKSLILLLSIAAFGVMTCAAQSAKLPDSLEPGNRIFVRTTEDVEASGSASDVFSAVADRDILDANGQVLIPRGSGIQLVVRKTTDNDLVLDIDSIIVNGLPYLVESMPNVLKGEGQPAAAVNNAGAVIGKLLGPLDPQMSVRGKRVRVPAESLLVFELISPLRALSETSLGTERQKASNYPKGTGTIFVGADKKVTWEGPALSSLYVQVDNEPERLFSRDAAGAEMAAWVNAGHLYSFIMKNADGSEIARTQLDFRPR